MPDVASWFNDWVTYHREVCDRPDWESTEDAPHFWGNFRRAFEQAEADMVAACWASDRVARKGPKYKGDHLPAIEEAVKAVLVERRDRLEFAAHSDVKLAQAQSADCPDCGGEGYAVRWRHQELAPGQSRYVQFYCTCAAGRAAKVRNAPRSRMDAIRPTVVPDLADYPAFHRKDVPWSDVPDNRFCYAPASWDAAKGRPVEVSLQSLKAMVAGSVRSARRQGRRYPVAS